MTNRSISVHTAFSCLLWPVGFTLVLIGLTSHWELGQLGLLLAGVAGVLNIRGFFCHLQQLERNAFDVGRDLGRSESESIRSLR